MRHFLLVVFFIGLGMSNGLHAQPTYRQYLSQSQYFQAFQLAESRLATHPQDSAALFYQGYSLLKLKEPVQAYPSLLAAEQAGFQPLQAARMARAMSLAQIGKHEAALQLLDSLIQNGYANLSILEDPLWAPVAEDTRYQVARDTVRLRSFPCLRDSNYRHFDFWLGEWEVFVGDVKVGDNVISRQAGGCSILEQYTTARDYVGQSLNFYDPHDDKWKQTWIDKTQNVSKYVETERHTGYLQFMTKSDSTPSSPLLRMTFEQQSNGDVSQVIEQSSDKGENWQVIFNGRYQRKK